MGETGIDIPEMYRGLVQHLPNTSAVIFDRDMRYQLAEGPIVDQLTARHGVSFIGKLPQEVLSPHFLDIIVPIQERTLKGESFNFEQTFPMGTYHSYANPLKDDAGQIIGGMILTHDVTEANRTESALRASEARFHSLADLVPVGIIQTDVDGNRVFCNTAWCEMTGITLEEALSDIDFQTIYPDDLEISSGAWDTMMATHTPFENAVFRYLRPDGATVWVSGNGTPLYDGQGNVTGYLGSVTNIDAQVRAQAALRESEARYRSVINTMSEGVILQTQDGTIQAYNPAAERIMGVTRDELMAVDGQDWPMLHDDGSPFPLETRPLTVTLRTGEPQTNVIIGLPKSGNRPRWIATNSRPLFVSDNPLPYAAVVTMRDITELHEADERLRQERDLLRTVIDSTPDYIFLKGLDGRYLLSNVAYASATHKSTPDEIVGQTVFDLWQPQIAARYQAEDQAILDSGQALVDEERKTVEADGEVKYVLTTKIPLRDAGGRVLGLLGIIRDTTERKRMENTIRQNEERLRIITDNIQDIVMQQDTAGRTVFASQSTRMALGYEPEALIGQDGMDLIHPDDRVPISSAGKRAREGGAQYVTLEGRTRHSDGHYIRLESVVKFLFDDQANYTGAVSISRDITERNRLQEMTLEREKLQTALEKELELGTLKTRMMQRIAHEFRTPLAIIQASVETLLFYLDRLTPDQREEKADMIVRQIATITDMLDQIGVVLHGSFKPGALHQAPTDVSAMCRQVAAELEAQLNRPGRFALDLPLHAVISADAHVLKGAFLHVMRNAARFSELSSVVSVSLRQGEKGIELRVSDTGIGILPDDQSHIFEPFFRGSNTNEIGGLGVGLTIALAAIEAHDGTITVESVPGQGTTVTLWIPWRFAADKGVNL